MAALNKFIGKIFYAAQGQGWSESYFCKATTKDGALLNVQALVTARKPMLYTGAEIVYSSVSDIGIKRDSFAAQADVLTGTDTITTNKPNRISDAILLRQETAAGRHANRFVHGVPDPEIIDGVYVGSGLADAWDTLLNTYITKLKSETAYLDRVNPADPTTWTLVDWTQVYKRGATSHRVGRPFDQQRGRRTTV